MSKPPVSWYRPPSEDAPDGEAVYGPRDPSIPGVDTGWLPAYSVESGNFNGACKQSNQPDSVAGYVSKIESLIKERDGLKERLSNSLESGGIKTVEIDRIKPELFAQQIAAAMRFADAPLTHDQFVTLVLYLKARAS